MSYRIIFHPEADKEYRESFLWYETHEKNLGHRFEIAVEEKIDVIANNPERFPKRKGAYREALINHFPYIIVYRVNKRLKQISFPLCFIQAVTP
jgi:plasmid stabilization system protein ParE